MIDRVCQPLLHESINRNYRAWYHSFQFEKAIMFNLTGKGWMIDQFRDTFHVVLIIQMFSLPETLLFVLGYKPAIY